LSKPYCNARATIYLFFDFNNLRRIAEHRPTASRIDFNT